MFLCDTCHGDQGLCGMLSRSRGRCEGCGEPAACMDCHVPEHKKKVKAKTSFDDDGPIDKICPQCGRRDSIEISRETGRRWCLYAADCGYSS